MNFELTDEQKLFAAQVRRFALAQLAKNRSRARTRPDSRSTWPS